MSLPTLYIRINQINNISGYIELTSEVTSLNLQSGRIAQLDTYGATSGEFSIRLTSTNSADLALVKVGCPVVLAATSTDYATAARRSYLKIADIRYEYGISANSDFVVFSLEGQLAQANRSILDSYSLSSGTITSQLSTVSAQVPGTYQWVDSTVENPTLDGTTINSVADWLQMVVTTLNCRIRDLEQNCKLVSKYYYVSWSDPIGGKSFVLTDGTLTLASTEIGVNYEGFTHSSLGENYYTYIIVDPESHAAQTAGTSKERVLSLSTLNYNTSQAQDYANYLLNTYDDPQNRPQSLAINGQSTNADLIFNTLRTMVGSSFPIIFRGNRTTAVIEGFGYSATPDQSSWTVYVSGADLNNYLILDDASRGVLDSNRLGY